MPFFIDDIWRKIQPITYRVLKDELPIADHENLFDALNYAPNQNEGIRRRTIALTDDLGSTEKDEQLIEEILFSTETDEQPIEEIPFSTEKDEKPIEESLCSTKKDEQPIEESLGSTEKDEQSNEDKIKKLTDAKLVLFGGTTAFYGFLVPLAAVIFGFENIGKCPANLYIPYMVIIIGLLSLLIVGYVCLKTKSKNFYCLEKNERKMIKMLSALLACVWIFQVALNFMDVSFDSSADNYCRHSFYIFTIVMNTFVVLGFNIGLGLWFYDPDFFNRTYSETPRPAYRLFPFESDSDSDSS